jgi:hypothetical protein
MACPPTPGAVQAVGGNGAGKLGQERHFPRDVGGEDRGDYLTEDDFVDFGTGQIGAVEQLARTWRANWTAGTSERSRSSERCAQAGNDHGPRPERHWSLIVHRSLFALFCAALAIALQRASTASWLPALDHHQRRHQRLACPTGAVCVVEGPQPMPLRLEKRFREQVSPGATAA